MNGKSAHHSIDNDVNSNDNNDDNDNNNDNNVDNNDNNNNNNNIPINPFLMILTDEDEQICMKQAETAMNTHRNLKVDLLPDLIDIYKSIDDMLVKDAQDYLRALPQHIEASKQQATEDWLKGKSEKEKEQYLQRHGQYI